MDDARGSGSRHEKSVFNVIATVIKEQMSRIGVTVNIRLVWLDK